MRHFPIRELGYAIGFIVALAAIYVGSYYAMVDRGALRDACWVRYPMGQKWAKPLFAAMHEVDRRLRPGFRQNEAPVLEALDEVSPERAKEFERDSDPNISVHTVITLPE